MARPALTTEEVVLEVAKKAVEIHREKVARYCQSLGWDAKRFDYCRDPTTINYFNKREFVKAYYALRRELGISVKWETLLRKLRKLAEVGDRIEYVDKRKGIYKLLLHPTPDS